MILPDGTAQRESTLVIADESLAAADWRNRRDGGEKLVAVEVEDVAMDVVGAGLEHHVGVGAGVAALIGFAAGLHGELVDGFDGNQAAGDAGNTALVGGDDAKPGSTLSAPSTWKLMLAVREPLTEFVSALAPGAK